MPANKSGKNRNPNGFNLKCGVSIFDIKLQTLPDALNTFEALIKAYTEDKIERDKYCGIVYGLNAYVGLMRLMKEEEIAKALLRVEDLLLEKEREAQRGIGGGTRLLTRESES